VGGAPHRRPPRGLAGLRLRTVASGGVLVVVADVDTVATPTVEALRSHDRIVRGLLTRFAAVLPARFGSVLADEPALAAALAGRGEEIAAGLALVEGREQMTLRLYGRAAAPTAPPPVREALGPGARYLRERMGALHAAEDVPELAPLRPALAGLVRAERAERHGTLPLLATVYHLVERGSTHTYRAAVAQGGPALAGVRARVSGPWPPYAFAPHTAA